MIYKVRELVGDICITLSAGQSVYDLIHPVLARKERVELDFSGVQIVASPFLNASIGQLLRDVSTIDLNTYLGIKSLPSFVAPVLKQVIDNAKLYYGDVHLSEAVDETVNAISGNNDAA